MAIETQSALSSADAELNQGNGSRSFDAAFQVSSGDGAWQPCPDAARQSESGEWWGSILKFYNFTILRF